MMALLPSNSLGNNLILRVHNENYADIKVKGALKLFGMVGLRDKWTSPYISYFLQKQAMTKVHLNPVSYYDLQIKLYISYLTTSKNLKTPPLQS